MSAPAGRVDLTGLRRLAEAVTPGPWELEHMPFGDDCEWPWRIKGICNFAEEGGSEADAAFIAAAPTTVLALLAAVEQHREERDELRRRVNGG